uniref:orotate phosphoribosyltransferase n=1 Tax=viral metagenome TaxID=1070528 RepID=A0A6C0KFJ6_9ZZZZ
MNKGLILKELHKNNIIQEGEFILKNGEKSNIYIDMRSIISYPFCFSLIIEYMSQIIEDNFGESSKELSLCGVPYGALPLATGISLKRTMNHIMLRKERKLHGLQKLVEGYTKNKKLILIEDVVTTGSSIKDACHALENEGFEIVCVICVLLRNKEIETTLGYPIKTVFYYEELVNSINLEVELYYSFNFSPKIKKWRENIVKKKSNIVLAYDKHFNELLPLLHKIKNYIVGLKIHSEILCMTDYQESELINFCYYNDIFLWEDRKMNDIANTIQEQVKKYELKRDFLSICPTSGPHSLNIDTKLGLFVLTEMSSKGNLFNPMISASILSFIERNPKHICGIIVQNELLFKSTPFLSIKPGIHSEIKEDTKGQQYTTIDSMRLKPDLLVVGRAITNISNPIDFFKALGKNYL